jgi:glutathione S-transferase
VLLEPFDQMLRHSPFVLGDMPVHTDFALFGIIGNLTYRNYNLLPPRLKALHAWQRRLLIFRFF